jgi:hypothetical protein
VRLDALTGLSTGQRTKLHRLVAEHLGDWTAVKSGSRPKTPCPSSARWTWSAACCAPTSPSTSSPRSTGCPGHRVPALGLFARTDRPSPDNRGSHCAPGHRHVRLRPDRRLPRPTWDWKNTEGMFSAKHDHASFTIEVVCPIRGPWQQSGTRSREPATTPTPQAWPTCRPITTHSATRATKATPPSTRSENHPEPNNRPSDTPRRRRPVLPQMGL